MCKFKKILMNIFKRDKERRFHILHYEMWDYIARELENAKPKDLKASNFVDSLKESFCSVNSKRESVLYNCYLCDFYTRCLECPLYRKHEMFCNDDNSLYAIAKSLGYSRNKRVEAARKIRDCVRR